MHTTTRLTVATTRLLHDATPAIHRGFIAALVALLVAIAIGWSPRSVAQPAPIIIVATATPPRGSGATHELKVLARMAAPATVIDMPSAAAMVQSAPTAEPQGYIAQTDQGAVFVPDDATPVPAGATYTGPFLAPVMTPEVSGPRLCTGFHDWRDYDAMYASSPVCHQP